MMPPDKIPIPFLSNHVLPHTLIFVLVGFLVQAPYFLLAVWARRHLGRNWSCAITQKMDHELVHTGPYRTIRHPIFTAMLGMFAASAAVSGTSHALIALAIVIIAYSR